MCLICCSFISNTNFMKEDFDFFTAVVNNARTDKKLWSRGCYFEHFKVQRTVVIFLVSNTVNCSYLLRIIQYHVAGQTVL